MKNNFSFDNQRTIAVHLHIFYEDMWPLMESYLKNLKGLDYDLFVTLVKANSGLEEKIRSFNPDCKIFVVENKGYDVGPFIYFLRQINLDNYDLILKIHTKSRKGSVSFSINNRHFNRKKWVDVLLNSLIGSQKMIAKNLKHFETDENLGMIASKYLITKNPNLSMGLQQDVYDVLRHLGYPYDKDIIFVPGTMFWVRSSLLKELKKHYTINDFSETDGKIDNGTLAHVMERVFGCLVVAQGFAVKGFDYRHFWQLGRYDFDFKRFLFQKKFTKTNREIIKICKIPIYSRRLKEKN